MKKLSITDLDCVKGFIRLCTIGDQQGFHERNGGNMTYHLTAKEVSLVKGILKGVKPAPWTDVDPKGDVAVPDLGGEWFLVTGSGKFMRNIGYDPEANMCLTELDKDGAHYRIWWGLVDREASHGNKKVVKGRPTSEFSSHLMNHQAKKRVAGDAFRVIYHAHPANLISMTYVVKPNDVDFTRAIFNTMTECPVIFPEGIGVVPWMVPGGREIAVATSKLMKDFSNVIWVHHGAFCVADTFDNAMGQMETLEKAARIYMTVLATGKKHTSDIVSDGYRAICKAFKVKIPEKYLK